MSETDIPITGSPTLIRDEQGLSLLRPVLTTLSVHGVPADANARHVVVRHGNEERFRFRLSGDDAQHLARLLAAPSAPEPSRVPA